MDALVDPPSAFDGQPRCPHPLLVAGLCALALACWPAAALAQGPTPDAAPTPGAVSPDPAPLPGPAEEPSASPPAPQATPAPQPQHQSSPPASAAPASPAAAAPVRQAARSDAAPARPAPKRRHPRRVREGPASQMPVDIHNLLPSTSTLNDTTRALLPAAAMLFLLFLASGSLLTLTMRAIRRQGP